MITVGIDSAKNRVDAVTFVHGKLWTHNTWDWTKAAQNGATRSEVLAALRYHVFAHLNVLDSIDWKEPNEEGIHVFVEESIAMRNLRVAVQLAHTVGMLLALPFPVTLVPIDSWKRELVGKGGVNKDAVRAEVIRRFPETEQLYGKRQDLFDATGVAVYGEAIRRVDLD